MSQRFLASALDSLSANIAILDEAGTIVAVNASWRRFADDNGLNWRDYGVGRNYFAVVKAASGDSAEGAMQAARGMQELIAGQRDQFYLEYPCHSPDEKRWFEMRATRFQSGEDTWLVTAHEDITTRKQVEEVLRESEARFWDLYHNAPNAYFSIGIDGLIYQCNKRATELLKYPIEELLGKPVFELYADMPDGREKAAKVFQRFLAGESITDEELQMQKADGTPIWVSLTVNAIRDAEGKILESRSMVVDITERKQAEESLRRVMRVFAERVKDLNFLYGISKLAGRQGASLEEILQGTVELIPSAWQYPEATWARIILAGEEFRTENFKEAAWRQSVDLVVYGECVGVLEVGYPEERPERDDRPFLTEERDLLNAIAERLGRVTERMRAEEALRESESRLAGILDSALDAVITIDENQKIVRFNPAAEKMFGYAATDVLGSPLNRLVPAQFRAAHTDQVRAFGRTNVTKRRMGSMGAVSGVRANDEEFPLEVSISQVDVSGQKFFTAIVRDVTERKLAEEALRESEETARALLNAPTDSAVLVEPDGTIVALNEPMARRLGQSPDELIGRNVFDFFPSDLAKTRQAHFDEIVRSGRPVRFEDMRAGRWYDNHMYPVFDAQGQVRRVAVYNHDITERKAVEQALQEAIEATEVARYEEHERRQEAERRRQIAEGLRDVLAALNSNQSVEEVLDLIVTQARRLLDTRAVGIYGLGAEVGTLAIEASKGLLITYVAGSNIPIGQESLRQAMVSCRPVAVPDVAAFPADVGVLAPDVRRQTSAGPWADLYRAWLAVPIISKDEVYGGMLLYYAEPRVFSEDEVELAVAFADQAALAIENSRLRDQIEQAAASAERGRLARELHDAVTQTLFSASLIAEAIPHVWERQPEQGQRGLDELRQLTKGALAEMRTMLVELRPSALTEKPLGELLRHLTEATTSRTRVPVALVVEGDSSLEPNLQIALYRIAQEALNNIARHARASQASVNLHCQPGRVALRISDDGCGFDPNDVLPDRLGMGTMRERAEHVGATLEIKSRPGHGTQVIVNWQNTGGEGF